MSHYEWDVCLNTLGCQNSACLCTLLILYMYNYNIHRIFLFHFHQKKDMFLFKIAMNFDLQIPNTMSIFVVQSRKPSIIRKKIPDYIIIWGFQCIPGVSSATTFFENNGFLLHLIQNKMKNFLRSKI